MFDYDKYGHCCLCHKNMLIEEAVGGKIIKRFLPDYDETQYLLDNGSKMRVAICKPCKETLTEKDEPKIMDCVIKGWQVEVDNINTWAKEKKEAYMSVYSQRKIICKSDDVPQDILDKKFTEHLVKKEKKNGTHK